MNRQRDDGESSGTPAGSSVPDSAATPAEPEERELTERDRQILEFERHWWRHVGAKEDAIRIEFGLSAARYYQLLGAVIERPAALVHDPLLVKRLLRMRDARTSARAARLLPGRD